MVLVYSNVLFNQLIQFLDSTSLSSSCHFCTAVGNKRLLPVNTSSSTSAHLKLEKITYKCLFCQSLNRLHVSDECSKNTVPKGLIQDYTSAVKRKGTELLLARK